MKRLALFFSLLFLVSALFAQSESKIALVFGNADYQSAGASLKNPVNDANDMTAELQNLNFRVTKILNGSKLEIENAIRTFCNQLKDNNLVMFYYSGHGFQLDGKNYIVPVDAVIDDRADAERYGIELDWIFGKVEVNSSGMNIFYA